MNLKIIFLLSISGFMIPSENLRFEPSPPHERMILVSAFDWQRLSDAVNQVIENQNVQERASSLRMTRPNTPAKPIDPDSTTLHKAYVRDVEQQAPKKFLFYAQVLKEIFGVDPDNVFPRCSRSRLKKILRVKVREGRLREKDAVRILQTLNLITQTMYEEAMSEEGLDLRLSPDHQAESSDDSEGEFDVD